MLMGNIMDGNLGQIIPSVKENIFMALWQLENDSLTI